MGANTLPGAKPIFRSNIFIDLVGYFHSLNSKLNVCSSKEEYQSGIVCVNIGFKCLFYHTAQKADSYKVIEIPLKTQPAAGQQVKKNML